MVGAVQKDKLLVDIGFNIGGVGIVAAAQVLHTYLVRFDAIVWLQPLYRPHV